MTLVSFGVESLNEMIRAAPFGRGCVVGNEQGYSGSQAAAIVGITYRQLDYWARTDLLRPSISEAQGSGSRRFYSYRNLLELRMIKSLLDSGIKLEAIREIFAYLRSNSDETITSAHLVISGSSVVLCQGDELVDVVRKGQGVLNLLPLAQVKDQVDGGIIDLLGAAPGMSPTAGDSETTRLVG